MQLARLFFPLFIGLTLIVGPILAMDLHDGLSCGGVTTGSPLTSLNEATLLQLSVMGGVSKLRRIFWRTVGARVAYGKKGPEIRLGSMTIQSESFESPLLHSVFAGSDSFRLFSIRKGDGASRPIGILVSYEEGKRPAILNRLFAEKPNAAGLERFALFPVDGLILHSSDDQGFRTFLELGMNTGGGDLSPYAPVYVAQPILKNLVRWQVVPGFDRLLGANFQFPVLGPVNSPTDSYAMELIKWGKFDLNLIPNGASVLTIGVGSGKYAAILAKLGCQVTAVAADPWAAVNLALSRALLEVESQVTIHDGDLAHLEKRNFPLAIFDAWKFHLGDRSTVRILDEVPGVLADGGSLLMMAQPRNLAQSIAYPNNLRIANEASLPTPNRAVTIGLFRFQKLTLPADRP